MSKPASTVDPSASIYEFVVLAVRQITTNREMGLTSATTLSSLDRRGPQRVTELADLAGVSQPSMTQLLQRLYARELVSRENDPGDGRATLFRLTRKGKRLLNEHRKVSQDRLADLLTQVPDVAALASAIEVALPALRAADQAGSPTPVT